jgi:hypothetical protein
MNKRLPEFGWAPEICAAFQKDNLRRSLCDKNPAQGAIVLLVLPPSDRVYLLVAFQFLGEDPSEAFREI